MVTTPLAPHMSNRAELRRLESVCHWGDRGGGVGIVVSPVFRVPERGSRRGAFNGDAAFGFMADAALIGRRKGGFGGIIVQQRRTVVESRLHANHLDFLN